MNDLGIMNGLGTLLGTLFAMAMVGMLALIVTLIVYIYNALAWSTIAKKLRHNKPWLAWIPIANIALILQLGGFHWAWAFLIIIPVVGWIAIAILSIIATWRIFEKKKYPGWLSLIPLAGFIPIVGWIATIVFLIILGIVAWGKK